MKCYNIYCDGCCKPNPGNMSIGVVVYDGDKKIHTISEKTGYGTNNIAEWTSVLEAVKYINRIEDEAELVIRMDSQLVVYQVLGKYSVGNPELVKIHRALMPLLQKFKWTIEHIPREMNAEADAAANEAFK